ncbi:pyridoxamine 5'-phosphate oxidase family protein [Deinococcus peraridilitoris]|uniref:Putative flavin-nucleotide-binding protein n=1 Tax=Deinococcus peraridilitoris (strain DSM 19664 / LMG 22246 / CIP 109416 / KR-200) TaxID=937777 RepID=L0A5B5_DEIPD|nr:pyridoxamine 5'-phosphate oxidase family protein [Deinococcus peraridilitoris]AFZ68200.1 putative flavin-nucleotide-binding protein [Deinococcus peraridilitoris DSM 19664]
MSYYDLSVHPPNRSRRPQNRRDDAWIRAFLHSAPIGRVATRWGEQPFVTPTTFWYDETQHEVIFHSNVVGRVRANSEQHQQVCIEASEMGALLPSNDPVELSVQYRSVMVFGRIRLLEGEAARTALYALMRKYFPELRPGVECRPIPDADLRHTSVYAVSIDGWSGKENWPERAQQTEDWPALPPGANPAMVAGAKQH